MDEEIDLARELSEEGSFGFPLSPTTVLKAEQVWEEERVCMCEVVDLHWAGNCCDTGGG